MNSTLNRSGIVFVISGPSGTGKSTICKHVLNADPRLHFSVSCTTRLPRKGEQDGKDYFFISKEQFNEHISEGNFLEYAEVHGNYYGTLYSEIDRIIKDGEDVLLDIDIQGVKNIQNKYETLSSPANCHYIFIGPPSFLELEERLRLRATESEDVIVQRLAAAKIELQHWRSYDSIIVNSNLDVAISNLKMIIQAQRLSRTVLLTSPWDE